MQVGKSLPLDIYYSESCFSLNNYVAGPRDCGKDITLFQNGPIFGLYQAKKTTKENAETTATGLKTVHCN